MRHSLALLAFAAPLSFGTVSLADVVAADLVCFSVMNGETGVIENAGISVGSNALAMSAFGPTGVELDEAGLPAGATMRNGIRTRQVGGSTQDGLTLQQIDTAVTQGVPGTWQITLDGSSYTGNLPSSVVSAPSARSYARLDADSVARLFSYQGDGDLLLALDSTLATTVHLAVYDDLNHRIEVLTSILAGDSTATITEMMANSLGFEPTDFFLLTETAPTALTFSMQGEGLMPNTIAVEYWELQVTDYRLVPAPGTVALIGLAGLIARRRQA